MKKSLDNLINKFNEHFIPARQPNFAGYVFMGDIMNKIYKIFISGICISMVISTSILFAGPEQRRGLVAAIGSLFYGEAQHQDAQIQQESVVDFLAKLHATNDAAFHQLFDYIVNKKGNLDSKLAQVLLEKKLIDSSTGALSQKLIDTFVFLKAIIDDYNKENKTNCCKTCCGGCLIPWCRENGVKIVEFTVANALTLITAVAKNKTATGSPKLTRATHPAELALEIAPLDIEIVLKRLSGNPID